MIVLRSKVFTKKNNTVRDSAENLATAGGLGLLSLKTIPKIQNKVVDLALEGISRESKNAPLLNAIESLKSKAEKEGIKITKDPKLSTSAGLRSDYEFEDLVRNLDKEGNVRKLPKAFRKALRQRKDKREYRINIKNPQQYSALPHELGHVEAFSSKNHLHRLTHNPVLKITSRASSIVSPLVGLSAGYKVGKADSEEEKKKAKRLRNVSFGMSSAKLVGDLVTEGTANINAVRLLKKAGASGKTIRGLASRSMIPAMGTYVAAGSIPILTNSATYHLGKTAGNIKRDLSNKKKKSEQEQSSLGED